MKKLKFITISFLLILLLSQCGPTKQDAINYNETIITDQKAVINAINNLENAFGTYDTIKIEKALQNAKQQLASAKSSLQKTGGFNEKNEFYDAIMTLYNLFEKQLNKEYAEQLKIYKLPEEEYTKEKEDRFNELSIILNKDYDIVSAKVHTAQQNFVNNWGLELIE